MNNIIKRWVEALRSGRYEQGKTQLRDDNKFCCLGVLCDIAVQDGVIRWRVNDALSSDGTARAGVLPVDVVEWAGLNHVDPNVRTGDRTYPLSTLNDDYGWTFEQIADAIESGLVN